jgi:divalent metal cation (Fe/Co/Zn/Cd) transporter
MNPRTKALVLSVFTVSYNLAEGAVAMLGASLSGSTALWGFGLDSFVESLSGTVMIWRFWKFDLTEDDEQFERVEQKASRLVAVTFYVLGGYVILDAGWSLSQHEAPEMSLIGIGLAVASLIVMPVLFIAKYRLGQSIRSRSLVADSKETLACVVLSVALLIGLSAYAIWNIWWLDSVTAIAIAALIIREGVETWDESHEPHKESFDVQTGD